jgi:hypothetical protein
MKQAAETNIPTWRAGTNLGNKVVLSSDFEIYIGTKTAQT